MRPVISPELRHTFLSFILFFYYFFIIISELLIRHLIFSPPFFPFSLSPSDRWDEGGGGDWRGERKGAGGKDEDEEEGGEAIVEFISHFIRKERQYFSAARGCLSLYRRQENY